MIADREMSKKTFERIDNLLHNITRRAADIKDNEIYRDADHAIALLLNLATEIQMEDEKVNQKPN